MDKKYSDNEVRGERSSRPKQVEKQALTLSFTKNAWDKYRQLTGSQKTFIDRELDDLKFNQNRQKKVNRLMQSLIRYLFLRKMV